MFRLCVVGSGGVGKSSLTIRYLKNEFTEYYDPTLEETYRKEIEYNGKLYDVEIVDTAGQEEFSSFRDSSVATGDAFLVLFAINSALSWHELKELRSKIIQDRQAASAIPMVMVGNKLDLEGEREVNKDEVLEYCNSSDVNIPLIETSAKMLDTLYVTENTLWSQTLGPVQTPLHTCAERNDELSAAEELCLNQIDWLERGGNIPTDDASDSADSTSTVRKDSSQKPRGQKKEK